MFGLAAVELASQTRSPPALWSSEVVATFGLVLVVFGLVGGGDACPLFPGKRYEDWELTDPFGRGVEDVRPIRDEIGLRVRDLLDSLGVPHRPSGR